jgi:transcriptional activator for dhaKLM operon
MQPSNAAIDLERLKRAWLAFTSTGRLADDLDPLIRLSWQRCAPRLNPTRPPQWTYVSDEVLPLALSQNNSLRAIARPIMEDVHQFIEGSGSVLLLLDSTTCVLDVLGDKATLDYFTSVGVRQGAFLSEGRLGTIAFATALIEGCPAQVVGPEHFLAAFHEIGSAAAPIFDLDGRPIGAVGLLRMAAQHNPHVLGIAVAAGKAIENQLQAEMFVQEANTRATELNTALDAISDGVLSWTARGTIMYLNEHAGQLLGLTPTAVVGRTLAEYLTFPEGLARAIAGGEELSDVETSFGVDGGQRECLVSLRVIRNAEGEPAIYIATLRYIEQVRQLVHQQVGTQARLTLDDLIGNSQAARQIRRQALSSANAKACLLILGESGTGKNVLARAIHNSSRRASGPFLAINCRALPRGLAISEFLGHEAGAFGNAHAGQPSKFELAHGGTLFLDEVESLSLDAQAALLRVIESGEVIRLSGGRIIPVDVRVIASSASDLEADVAAGTFRSDLLFRLRSFVIAIPPLRERPEDVPLLIDQLLDKLSVQVGQTLGLTPAAREALRAYPWPGNVRELESVLERAALLCDRQPINLGHLPEAVRQRRAVIPGKPLTVPVRSLVEVEKQAILSAGRATSGNLSEAARLLGIGRTTLWRKMKELGIMAEDFRVPQRA